MIKEKIMITLLCDNCGKDSCDGTDYSCWSDAEQAILNATESDWVVHEGKEPIYQIRQHLEGRTPEWVETSFVYYTVTHPYNRRKTEATVDKYYCPECVSYDDEDNLILKNVKP